MGSNVMLWAGKRLTDEEAAVTRRAIALQRRLGDEETALNLARFLPESATHGARTSSRSARTRAPGSA